MIRPKNDTEDLILSKTKNCETLINQTHTKTEETFEFKITKSRETFHFKPSVQIKGDWMLGLTSLEAYNSIFNITEENNKFELLTGSPNNAFSFGELKDKLAKQLVFHIFHPRIYNTKYMDPKLSEVVENC